MQASTFVRFSLSNLSRLVKLTSLRLHSTDGPCGHILTSLGGLQPLQRLRCLSLTSDDNGENGYFDLDQQAVQRADAVAAALVGLPALEQVRWA